MKTDPEGASAWLETVELAPEHEAQVRAGIETPDPDVQAELEAQG